MISLRLLVCSALAAGALSPTGALGQDYQLIDDFALEVSARSNDLDTTIRVDGPMTAGTTINLEDGLGLSKSEQNLGVSAEWRLGHRHLLSGAWANHERDTTRRIRETIKIGEVVFPVDVDVRTKFDIETITVSYQYLLVLKERVTFGIGGGARVYDFRIAASANQLDLAEDADVSGPMPFVGMDWRYGLTPRWRLRATAGFFDISIDEYDGSQVLGELALEFRPMKRLSVGVAGDIGTLDVDVNGELWDGAVDSDVLGTRAFARVLW